jgi:hypothetical protein
LFVPRLAVRAGAAGIYHASHRGKVAGLEFRDAVANTGHTAHDFVTRHAWINGIVPFVARLMEIGMTNAAKENVDLDVCGAWFAATDRERGERGRRGVSRIGFRGECWYLPRGCRCLNIGLCRECIHDRTLQRKFQAALAQRAKILTYRATDHDCLPHLCKESCHGKRAEIAFDPKEMFDRLGIHTRCKSIRAFRLHR